MKILRRFYTSLFLAAALTTSVVALPEGASVQAGSVNIQSNGSTQTITQSSDRAIINWNGFNIDVGELVHFIQPNSISAILNRVVGQDPSQILGSMRANGQVFLINPNGVVFGPGANIDVGSLVVSTLDIADDDFMAGRLEFEQQADKDLAGIINHGTIKIDSNGFLVLTGPMVANEGIILAKVGQVALAGGTKSTISFDPTGLIQVELPGGSQSTDGIVSVSQGDV
ncbi:MAG TPA: filamentous hemagglutinin N-terminal domain-containing protein, partial [Phycisphaerales bacterium]|nr:filamentous hemagglutinin N-terminal domain-containing protein [Phycisphaerales bacterium]